MTTRPAAGRPQTGRPAPPPVAELDRRCYAFAVDRAITWGLVVALLVIRGDAVVPFTVGLLVEVGLALLLGLRGTSPGLAPLGLRTVRADTGGPIGVRRALLRHLVLAVAALPTLGLGLALLAWSVASDPTGRRRGWHDHLARSIVVDVRPQPVAEPEADPEPAGLVNLTAMRLAPEANPAPATAPAPTPARPAVPPTAAARPPAPTRWRVAFDTGGTFVVEGLAIVGRRPEPTPGQQVRHLVPLPSADLSLSKTHAQLQVASDGALVVMDRGSANGSTLVRRGVSRDLTPGRPATLLDGDLVRFGDREMSVLHEG